MNYENGGQMEIETKDMDSAYGDSFARKLGFCTKQLKSSTRGMQLMKPTEMNRAMNKRTKRNNNSRL